MWWAKQHGEGKTSNSCNSHLEGLSLFFFSKGVGEQGERRKGIFKKKIIKSKGRLKFPMVLIKILPHVILPWVPLDCP